MVTRRSYRLDPELGRIDERPRRTRVSNAPPPPIGEVLTVTALTSTTVRVDFAMTVVRNQALTAAANYVIYLSGETTDPAIRVFAVVADTDNPPAFVVLTTEEMLDLEPYDLEVQIVQSSTAGAFASLWGSFVGIGIAPQVSSAEARGARLVRVLFSEPMASTVALLAAASYTITEGVGAQAVQVLQVTPEPLTSGPTYVDLRLDLDLTVGTDNYEVEVLDTVQDLAGNTLDPLADTALFGGAHAEPDLDFCEIGKNRLAEVYRKPGIEALVCLLGEMVQEADQAILDTRAFRSLETAFGAQLDALGTTLRLSRQALTDEEYRVRLTAKAMVIGSQGRPNELIEILLQLDNGFTASEGGAIELEESYPAAAILRGTLVPPGDLDRGATFALDFLRPAKSAGVKLIHEFWETDVVLFQMQDDGGPAPPAGSGFAEDSAPTVGGHMKEAV